MFYSYNFCVLLILPLCFNQCLSWCWWTKCCLESKAVIADLASNMTSSLFGQHLVSQPILTALESHFNHNPQKALTLTFLGPAGVGKTFTAKKIAHHIFNGDQRYVKFYSGRNDFADSVDLAVHKTRLAEDIKDTVSRCGHSIFIFDEAEKMADGLFDVLRPFTDFLDHYQGVDYRRAIFIFISNVGTSELLNIYYNRPGKREDLKLIDFENILSKWLYNKSGGFKSSALIVNFLVDYYIPFLPLEEEHIKKCIKVILSQNGLQPTEQILKTLYEQQPKKKHGNIEYTPSNCKRISTEVGSFIISIKREIKRSRDEM